jgi:cytoskeletal protein CcmA (bactofilin family)
MVAENLPACIGQSIVIHGEVKGNEDLIINGCVEGTLSLSENRLTIGPQATVTANITAKDVIVQGNLQGDVLASGRVELRSGCKVEGDIKALRLAVEDNALYRGKVDLTQSTSRGYESNVASTPAGAL